MAIGDKETMKKNVHPGVAMSPSQQEKKLAFGLASPAELASACFVKVLQTIIAFLHSHLADHKSLSHSQFHILLINSNHHFTSSLHPLSPILRCRLLHFGLQLEQWQSLHVVQSGRNEP